MADEVTPNPGSRPVSDPTDLTRIAVKEAVERSQEYVDGKVAVLEERLRGIDRASEVLHQTVTQVPTDTQVEVGHLRELTDEKLVGVEKVLTEQRRGMDVAEREREKSASALRIELARAIEEGDRNLRDHIAAQVAQIESSLVSADLLEQERTARVSERIDAERRITELTRALSEQAILKAEAAATKQFDAVVREIADLRQSVAAMTEQLAAKLS